MDDPVSAVGVGEDADEVESDLFVEDFGFIHILLGVFLQGTDFAVRDGMLDISEGFIAAVFYFDENEGGAIEGDDIEFTVALAPVPVKDPESFALEVPGSKPFPEFTCFQSAHGEPAIIICTSRV